ncbi:MAG: flagellar motor protein PomA [endosymbiont of Galathealinum brachiosum]|uniref:Flagellar motor protein PomA n=1 Tax=endosymbiont of Galathealinum brachiosum TaxID=2200906 RepID=A0A370DLE1_9GAMM|nr:MAG: flagellar motor protein PomA [endosymbiont of Galathealinum brachiosum]
MDLATLLGLIIAFGFIVGAIVSGGSFILFVNVPSLLIVIGGSIAVVLMQFTVSQFFGAFKVGLKAFLHKSVDASQLIEQAGVLANIARKEGMMALESQEIENPFLNKGIQLCVDGHPPDLVRKMLSKDISLTIQRHELGQRIFTALGDIAPAMGMIGTLIGLVQMLANMEDPKTIGPAMAVALLTTLYGAIIANAFALPIADKLELRSQEEKTNRTLILETISGIQEGMNPRVLEELLKAFLPEGQRDTEETADE